MAIDTLQNRMKSELVPLQAALLDRARQASDMPGDTVIAATVPLSLDVRQLADVLARPSIRESAWWWRAAGADSPVVCGVGSLRKLSANGVHRFEQMSQAWQDWRLQLAGPGSRDVQFFFGFSFSSAPLQGVWAEWPNASLILPRYLFRWSPKEGTTVTALVAMEAGEDFASACRTTIERLETCLGTIEADRTRKTTEGSASWSTTLEAYQTWVSQSVADIRQKRYDKVVMARQEWVPVTGLDRVPEALLRLQKDYPQSTIFAVRQGQACFLGASPERLVDTCDDNVSVDCLAGSTQRGEDADADEALATELQHSAKNLREHELVVSTIRDVLETHAGPTTLVNHQEILKLPNVQHLYSRVTAKLPPGTNLLELAGKLHPTPAVAGYPVDVAASVIGHREQFERGWYSGGVGLVDAAGNGHVAVTLRSALSTHQGTVLFAGAGIMGDSDPLAEWQETELKLRPMRRAFDSTGDCTEDDVRNAHS